MSAFLKNSPNTLKIICKNQHQGIFAIGSASVASDSGIFAIVNVCKQRGIYNRPYLVATDNGHL